MAGFMIHLGCMSFQTSLIICVILIIRKLFSIAHISKKYVMLLWIIPFFFLIFPWKISLPAGFWNNAPADYGVEHLKQQVNTDEWGDIAEQVNMYEDKQKTTEKSEQSNVNKKEIFSEQKVLEPVSENSDYVYENKQNSEIDSFSKLLFLSGIMWGVGVVCLIFHSAISYWRLKRKVQCSINGNGYYYADDIQVPMVLGIVKSRIYIPSGMKEEHLEYVIAHEKTHIRRKDSVIKIIAYCITCIHWFNPLIWFAYHLMAKDMEMTCDEETLQRIGIDKKKEYALALLQLSAGKRNMFAVPLTFGNGDIKGRIKNVMHYQKTVKLSAIMAIAIGVVIALIFITKGENTLATGRKLTKEAESGELTFKMVRYAFANQTVDQLDFHNYTNGKEKYFDDRHALNYYINFFYEYNGEEYRLQTYYSKRTNAMEQIYITRSSDLETCCLYIVDGDKGKYLNNLETFLATKTEIGDWLTIELPKGYTIGDYLGTVGWSGGACISPISYDDAGIDDTSTPNEWQASGSVGRIRDADKEFSFKNGKLQSNYFPHHNHSSFDEVEVLDYLDCPVLMVHWYFDLYTGAKMAELEQGGVELTETVSEYWYFYFVKEGETEAYYLSLSAKEFSKEEAIEIVKTVKIIK